MAGLQPQGQRERTRGTRAPGARDVTATPATARPDANAVQGLPTMPMQPTPQRPMMGANPVLRALGDAGAARQFINAVNGPPPMTPGQMLTQQNEQRTTAPYLGSSGFNPAQSDLTPGQMLRSQDNYRPFSGQPYNTAESPLTPGEQLRMRDAGRAQGIGMNAPTQQFNAAQSDLTPGQLLRLMDAQRRGGGRL